MPTWALTHENSIVQFALSRNLPCFFDEVAVVVESVEILLSVKIVAVRGVFSVISIVSTWT